jgi:hypothetical protein
MSRHFEDWLKAYQDYAGFTEAPARMHFGVGYRLLLVHCDGMSGSINFTIDGTPTNILS